MRSALVLVGFTLAVTACSKAVPASALARPPVVPVVAPPPVAIAVATSCRAAPSTVYGSEPVVFDIEGSPSAALLAVELHDQRDQTVARGAVQLPAQWRPADVQSGDFTLRTGSNQVGCTVTVNRELARGRAAEQK